MVSKSDTLLEELGCGKWNLIVILLIGYWSAQIPAHSLGGTYLTPSLEHSCKIPGDGFPIFTEENENITTVEACWYNKNTSEGVEKVPCTEWDFDNSTFLTTLTSEFQMVCEKEYLRPTFQSVYFIGALTAAPIIGFLSDRYGRKTVMTVGITVYSTLANIICWLPNLPPILAARFILGLMHPTSLAVPYTLAMEQSAPRHRAAVGILTFLPWIIGYFTWAGQAYLIKEWRWLMFSVPIPSLLAIPVLWFVDESPRWLIQRGYHDRALKVLKRAARLNKAKLPPDEELLTLMKLIQTEGSESKIQPQQGTSQFRKLLKTMGEETIILVRTPVMRRITVSLYCLFLVCGIVYYGLSLSGGDLGTDPFIYMALSGLMEIPGSTVTLPMINILGRRRSNIICFLATGVSLLLLTFIPKGWVATTMALLGKMTISAAYQVVYLHATELFPTEVRVRGLGTSVMVSKTGSIIVPYIINALGAIYWWGPSVLCGALSVLACVVCFMLPETLRAALPDTVAALEMTAQMQKREKIRNKEKSAAMNQDEIASFSI
ncbi:organic cation transporter protein-like [Macrobrachium rosenbergii]|uniref:organic cation transporter protein-like n=1 Tax=Macrobrachium rosenbergii TaxID=79674 RepID=UPI0034D5EEEC